MLSLTTPVQNCYRLCTAAVLISRYCDQKPNFETQALALCLTHQRLHILYQMLNRTTSSNFKLGKPRVYQPPDESHSTQLLCRHNHLFNQNLNSKLQNDGVQMVRKVYLQPVKSLPTASFGSNSWFFASLQVTHISPLYVTTSQRGTSEAAAILCLMTKSRPAVAVKQLRITQWTHPFRSKRVLRLVNVFRLLP
ncbi:hypothetical protein Mapa_015930 [Marchantia paleacea]|nr:hypothetical protein Mapa_015930 [Marchantia paleacea]